MDKRMRAINTLIIGDNELECKCESKTIDDINITMVGFNIKDLDKYDMIIYDGSKGTKIIKSKYTKTGKIE